MMADAAKAANVGLVIYAGLPNYSKITNGKVGDATLAATCSSPSPNGLRVALPDEFTPCGYAMHAHSTSTWIISMAKPKWKTMRPVKAWHWSLCSQVRVQGQYRSERADRIC